MDSDGSEDSSPQTPDCAAPQTHTWPVSRSFASQIKNNGKGQQAYFPNHPDQFFIDLGYEAEHPSATTATSASHVHPHNALMQRDLVDWSSHQVMLPSNSTWLTNEVSFSPTGNSDAIDAEYRSQAASHIYPQKFAYDSIYSTNTGPTSPSKSLPKPSSSRYVDQSFSKFSQIGFGTVHYDEQSKKYYYGCHFCTGKRFGRPQDLKRHVKHKHQDEVTLCPKPECGRFFPAVRADYLHKHIANAHVAQNLEQNHDGSSLILQDGERSNKFI